MLQQTLPSGELLQHLILYNGNQTSSQMLWSALSCLDMINVLLVLVGIKSPKLWSWILFTNPSARAGYDTRSIFKRSLTSFNFPSPRLVASPRLKNLVCPTIYP